MKESFHSIGAVAHRTGLSPHVIRVWEKRYGAVTPTRTETNRRVYAETEVSRLELLRAATDAGHSIGQIARLPVPQLQSLVTDQRTIEQPHRNPTRPPSSSRAGTGFEESIAAIRHLDGPGLERIFERSLVSLGSNGFLVQLISPLAQAIGNLWREGIITAAHEHFATVIIRSFLSQAFRSSTAPSNAPILIVTTPSGQIHEMGALIVSAAATALGWRVTYLGPNLPAAEIAGAATQNHACAVALSLVYPEDDPLIGDELRSLRKLLPTETAILIGGRAAGAYSLVLDEIGALTTTTLEGFANHLDFLRSRRTLGSG